VPIDNLCEAFASWMKRSSPVAARLQLDITKSCLLHRLIYGGEPLRSEQCPIHHGEWSGSRPDPCPAGCSYGYDITGWLPTRQ
jgi:hypothetical protein